MQAGTAPPQVVDADDPPASETERKLGEMSAVVVWVLAREHVADVVHAEDHLLGVDNHNRLHHATGAL
jgi:hypothetical protein